MLSRPVSKMRKRSFVAVLILLIIAQPLYAWFDGGHMLVAYIAYKNLTPKTRARVDTLLKLNPMYVQWTQEVSEDPTGFVAFLHGATWPDSIKQTACTDDCKPDSGDTPPAPPEGAQTTAYADKLL